MTTCNKLHGRTLETIILAAVMAIALGSCSQGTSGPDTESTTTTPYFAGYIGSTPTSTPCYWDEGNCTTLGTGSTYTNGLARRLLASGDGLYIAGSVNTSDSDDGVPCIWKDGTITELDISAELTNASNGAEDISFGTAREIAILDGHVYVAGTVESSARSYPYLWTDGTGAQMAALDVDGTVYPYGAAYECAVSGSSLYIAGACQTASDESGDYPCYWKDGVGIALLDGSAKFRSGYAFAVTVADGVVYAAGQIGYSTNLPCYWEDGAITCLADSHGVVVYGEVYDMCVANGVVYCVGFVRDSVSLVYIPCYWKDGSCTNLSLSSGTSGFATLVSVSDGVVYIGGYTALSNTDTPCVWTDGVYAALPTGSGSGGEVAPQY